MNTNQRVLSLKKASVRRDGQKILHDISWDIDAGQNWFVMGPNGSGKTTLLRMIRGEVWPSVNGSNPRVYYLNGRPQTSPLGVLDKISIISPELQDKYIRFNLNLPAFTVVHSGFFNSLRPCSPPTEEQREKILSVLKLLNIKNKIKAAFCDLSRGEARKVLLARALVTDPELLMLDEPCAGLDESSKEEFMEHLDELAEKGLQFIMASHRMDEFPESTTHLGQMEKGRLIRKVKVSQQKRALHRISPTVEVRNTISALSSREKEEINPGKKLLDIQSAGVVNKGKAILKDINWQMHHGENWAVFGPNGSGKSTFLKLIYGLAPPYAGGKVERYFNSNSRDIRDIRCQIGFLSPDFQARTYANLTSRDVVLTGFYASEILYSADHMPQYLERADEVISALGLEHLADKKVWTLSYGQLRQVLLARAIVGRPKLLLMDEPFNGLDMRARAEFMMVLETAAQHGASIIMATHYPDDLPSCITHVLALEKGRIIFKEDARAFFRS